MSENEKNEDVEFSDFTKEAIKVFEDADGKDCIKTFMQHVFVEVSQGRVAMCDFVELMDDWYSGLTYEVGFENGYEQGWDDALSDDDEGCECECELCQCENAPKGVTCVDKSKLN